MPQDDTQQVPSEHPAWCYQSDDHDPHKSAPERVGRDFPSDLVIEAYLMRLNRNPKATLAALEFSQPGEETVQHLLTLGQLRHLSEALTRLVTAEEGLGPRTATAATNGDCGGFGGGVTWEGIKPDSEDIGAVTRRV